MPEPERPYETSLRRYSGSYDQASVPSERALPLRSYEYVQSLIFPASGFAWESEASLPNASYVRFSKIPFPWETAERWFPRYEYEATFCALHPEMADETEAGLHAASRATQNALPDGSVRDVSNPLRS